MGRKWFSLTRIRRQSVTGDVGARDNVYPAYIVNFDARLQNMSPSLALLETTVLGQDCLPY